MTLIWLIVLIILTDFIILKALIILMDLMRLKAVMTLIDLMELMSLILLKSCESDTVALQGGTRTECRMNP